MLPLKDSNEHSYHQEESPDLHTVIPVVQYVWKYCTVRPFNLFFETTERAGNSFNGITILLHTDIWQQATLACSAADELLGP